MRTYLTAFFAVTYFILCISCGDSMPASTEVSYSQIENESSVAKDPNHPAPSTVGKQNEAEAPLDFTISCEEKEEVNPESEDPFIIRTCTYGNYRSVSTGSPDYKGRYYWECQLYKAKNGEYIAVSNSVLFNEKQSELLRQVNQRIKADHLELLSDSETIECLEMREPMRDFQLNEMGISFEQDQVVFYAEFGLPDACRSVDGTWVAIKLKDIEPYLNK